MSGQKKKFTTIAIEGNIGSGKTTFLRHLQRLDEKKEMSCFAEPIESWRDVRGCNLFGLMAEDVDRWSFPFQSFVQLSMVRLHQREPTAAIKLMERTIFSARYCFVENLYRRHHLRPEEYHILDEWFRHLIGRESGLSVDLIVYLKTDPEVVFERIQRRHRSEEKNITLDYLRDLHDLHEQWLADGKWSVPAPVVTIDGNSGLVEMESIVESIHSKQILKAFKQ